MTAVTLAHLLPDRGVAGCFASSETMLPRFLAVVGYPLKRPFKHMFGANLSPPAVVPHRLKRAESARARCSFYRLDEKRRLVLPADWPYSNSQQPGGFEGVVPAVEPLKSDGRSVVK